MKNNTAAIRMVKVSVREPIRLDTKETTIISVTDTNIAPYASVHLRKFSTALS